MNASQMKFEAVFLYIRLVNSFHKCWNHVSKARKLAFSGTENIC